MKMVEFLERLPESFAQEILTALPGPDRKDLLRSHGAKVKVTAGSLKRSVRAAKETRLLMAALKKTEDLDSQRTFLQGWLARRADMIVHFLDKWEIKHQGGIVEDFGWVEKLTPEQVTASMEELPEELEPIAPLVYFAYLQLPCSAEVLDLDALFAGVDAVKS